MIIDITGFDAVIRLFDADSATISANAVGSPPAAAMLIAIGTMMMVAPTWLIASENAVVSSPIGICSSHNGNAFRQMFQVCPASHAAAPLESIAQPSGIRQAIRTPSSS